MITDYQPAVRATRSHKGQQSKTRSLGSPDHPLTSIAHSSLGVCRGLVDMVNYALTGAEPSRFLIPFFTGWLLKSLETMITSMSVTAVKHIHFMSFAYFFQGKTYFISQIHAIFSKV